MLLIILILLIIGFGYGGYRVGPGWDTTAEAGSAWR